MIFRIQTATPTEVTFNVVTTLGAQLITVPVGGTLEVTTTVRTAMDESYSVFEASEWAERYKDTTDAPKLPLHAPDTP